MASRNTKPPITIQSMNRLTRLHRTMGRRTGHMGPMIPTMDCKLHRGKRPSQIGLSGPHISNRSIVLNGALQADPTVVVRPRSRHQACRRTTLMTAGHRHTGSPSPTGRRRVRRSTGRRIRLWTIATRRSPPAGPTRAVRRRRPRAGLLRHAIHRSRRGRGSRLGPSRRLRRFRKARPRVRDDRHPRDLHRRELRPNPGG